MQKPLQITGAPSPIQESHFFFFTPRDWGKKISPHFEFCKFSPQRSTAFRLSAASALALIGQGSSTALQEEGGDWLAGSTLPFPSSLPSFFPLDGRWVPTRENGHPRAALSSHSNNRETTSVPEKNCERLEYGCGSERVPELGHGVRAAAGVAQPGAAWAKRRRSRARSGQL